MRYVIKGGIWKNSQDQILKAAIMKYGMNQWSRISSLLQRKSARQCKQRWYEWLDPSIKKTQWTKQEDQKLLHLARVLPSHWRSIGPYIGRTPAQCYQRYEKLLDIAQGRQKNDFNDLRKLRPGEIDPNPQTKPARPDPIDMDEDQKEMMAEARVRLANTKGKKAKRKQRQKMIQQARRLAQLQKLRELKIVGVDNIMTTNQLNKHKKKQKRDECYYRTDPDHRNVQSFAFVPPDHQQPQPTLHQTNINLQVLEGRRRDQEDQLRRKADSRKLKKMKQRDMVRVANLISAPKQAAQRLNLPPAHFSDRELQLMKKVMTFNSGESQMVEQGQKGDQRGLGGEWQSSPLSIRQLLSKLPQPQNQIQFQIQQEQQQFEQVPEQPEPLQDRFASFILQKGLPLPFRLLDSRGLIQQQCLRLQMRDCYEHMDQHMQIDFSKMQQVQQLTRGQLQQAQFLIQSQASNQRSLNLPQSQLGQENNQILQVQFSQILAQICKFQKKAEKSDYTRKQIQLLLEENRLLVSQLQQVRQLRRAGQEGCREEIKWLQQHFQGLKRAIYN